MGIRDRFGYAVAICIAGALPAAAAELPVNAPPLYYPYPALAPAVLVSVTPNRGQQGQAIAVTIIAKDTQFTPGVTEAKFGDGILVGGGGDGDFGPITVTSPTSATAQIIIADDADLDERNVIVRTLQERVVLKDAFSVTPASARVNVTPDRGRQGEKLTITITGQNTHFQNGVTEANFGDDISVGGQDAGRFGPVVVSSPTRATARIQLMASCF